MPVADKVIDDLIGLFTAPGVHPVQAAQYESHFVAHGRGEDAGIIRSQHHEGSRALIAVIQPAQQVMMLCPLVMTDADIAGRQSLYGHSSFAQILHDGILHGAQQFG